MKVDITGAQIYFEIPVWGGIPITETIVNTWIVMMTVLLFCIWLTRKMKIHGTSKRQLIAEVIVVKVTSWVRSNMGERYSNSDFPAFISALFAMSALCSLIGLLGMYPPTADLSTTLGWAAMVFVMITYTKIRTYKVKGYVKEFFSPVPLLMPLNVISELSTPISMAFRHFGNIASGQVIGALVYAALAVLSSSIFQMIPGMIGNMLSQIPLFQIGIPAVLSIYFDVFSGCMQAFIFSMLTMNYIAAVE
ncbi:MAG: F0F1 ATP synthase subunit A [Lachnospiraceae bacterium]